MKNDYIAKINKAGKTGRIISKICVVMMYVALVSCIVASVLLALLPCDSVMITTDHRAYIEIDMTHSIMPSLVGLDTDSDGSFELNGIKYDSFSIEDNLHSQTATASSSPYRYSLKDTIWIFLGGIILSFTLVYSLKRLSAIFSSLEGCETPFTAEIAENLKKLAISFIPVSVSVWLIETLTTAITTGVWDITIGIDLTVVMLVVIIMLLSEIFRYGTMLQQESDETL